MFFPKPILPNRLDEPPSPFLTFNYGWDNLQEGMARLKKQAEWLAAHYPGAAASLGEGLEETFTINRLELSPTLRHCLGTPILLRAPTPGCV